MKVFTVQVLKHMFTYHPPKPDQLKKYEQLRVAGMHLAAMIAENCPKSDERDNAILKVREAVMMANMSIACADGPEPISRTEDGPCCPGFADGKAHNEWCHKMQ